MRQRSGFTMLELMITLAILSALTVLAVRSIQQSLFSKTKIQGQLDDVSSLRDAMRLFERDVNLTVHSLDQEKLFNDQLKKIQQAAAKTQAQQQQQQPQQPAGFGQTTATDYDAARAQDEQVAASAAEAAYQRISPVSEFIGDPQKITFESRNPVTATASDVVVLHYSLESCPDGGRGQCLYRQEKQFFDDAQDMKTGRALILSGITELTFKYQGDGETEWKETWKDTTKFPTAVQLTVSVERGEPPKVRKLSMQEVTPIRFPNNPAPAAAAATSTGTSPGAPPSP